MNPSYNNLGSFGTGGVVPPVSSGTGDIILAPEKKSHKKIVIIIIIILIVVGLFAIMLFVFGNNRRANVDANSKLAFYRYANYLLYGDDSDEVLEGEYNEENGSELYTVLLSEESEMQRQYADNLDGLWQVFSGAVNNFTISDGQTINDYNDRISFIVTYMRNNRSLIEDKMIKSIINDDEGNSTRIIEDYLKQFSAYDFEEAKAYQESSKLYFETYNDLITKFNDAGCLSENGDITLESEECLSVMSDENENNVAMEDRYLTMNDKVSEIVVYLVKNCWDISIMIGGGGE